MCGFYWLAVLSASTNATFLDNTVLRTLCEQKSPTCQWGCFIKGKDGETN
jgi:hypothetical protein